MKKENIKFTNLIKEIINEVGDLKNISNFNYDLTKNGGIFYIEDKYRCIVTLNKIPLKLYSSLNLPPILDYENRDIISVGFSIEGNDEQYLKSNYELLLKTLKTVVNILKDSINRYPYNVIFIFIATSKLGVGFNDSQKMLLYKAILQQNIPTGYRMGEGEFLNNKLIFLTKK